MKHRMATPEGRAVYSRRKCTVEPVFGIIKSVLGFRQFHLRGLKNVSGEWTLVSIAWNLKRLFHLRPTTNAADRTPNGLKRGSSGRKNCSTHSFRSDASPGDVQLGCRRTFSSPNRVRGGALSILMPVLSESSPTGC
jgi:hypothetical protein